MFLVGYDMILSTTSLSHTWQEIIVLAQAIWEGLPWLEISKWVDKMPRRIEELRQ